MPELEVGFYLLGDIPESSELEQVFGVQPIVNFRGGQPRVHAKSGTHLGTHSDTVWGFTTRHIQSNEIQPHLDWLLSFASAARTLLEARPGATAFFEISLAEGDSTVLPRSFLKFVEELRAEVGFVARREHAA